MVGPVQARWVRGWQLWGVLLSTLLALVAPTSVVAGTLNKAVIAELLQTAGWTPIGSEPDIGLSMYEKPLKSVGLTAYMGVRDIPDDVDVNKLWTAIADVANHDRVGDKLAESTLIRRHGTGVDSYQVLKAPSLMPSAQRYWFVHGESQVNINGLAGHNRRCWSILPEGEAAEARAVVSERYPSASPIPLTHGCWEVLPAAPGAPARLRYFTVSDPGGSLARTAVSLLTTRTLPENMASFINYARK
jgi:hypothetical protein